MRVLSRGTAIAAPISEANPRFLLLLPQETGRNFFRATLMTNDGQERKTLTETDKANLQTAMTAACNRYVDLGGTWDFPDEQPNSAEFSFSFGFRLPENIITDLGRVMTDALSRCGYTVVIVPGV